MTPKEKVDQLFHRFNTETNMQHPYDHATHMRKTKQSVIICIEEIIKARKAGTTGVILDKEYWEEALEIAHNLKY